MSLILSHEHKFARGQTVLFAPGAMDGNAPRGDYVILLCLPDDGIGFQYAIRSTADSHERTVREHRLKAAGSAPQFPTSGLGRRDAR
jgi:hypothetical protein